MKIIYKTSKMENSQLIELDDVITTFNQDYRFDRRNAEDMRDALALRGWYEGVDPEGRRYLVFVFGKLGVVPTPETYDSYEELY